MTHPKSVAGVATRGRGRRAARRTRVVVADRQAIDRAGLVRLLESKRNVGVAGEAASVDETIEQCCARTPDVLVLSLNLEGAGEAPAISTILRALPALRILALSERGASNCLVLNPPARERVPAGLQASCARGIDCLQLAVAQGAMGTLRRGAEPEELFRAVRALAQGRAWYDASTPAEIVLGGATEIPPGGTRRRDLSNRERDVAALLSEGFSNKEISSALEIGEPTVKKYVGRVLAKLGVKDRLQAGLFVARHPLLLQHNGGEFAPRD
ncbi:MAG TPA: response regulator transcription factor [Candidatus Udaeobacter sp.]|jgi:DNA-binding NarL/FixJ family response regulator|nr:response regulator transcription factor [Candidatus Udaeobacter sp.]